jgi:hypothetical protein
VDWVRDGNPNQINRIINMVEFRTRHNVPVWVGETGENSASWMQQNINTMDSQKVGWCHWTYKRHDVGENAALLRIGGNYPTDGVTAMSTVLEQIKFANNIKNTNTIAAVTASLPAPRTSGCNFNAPPACTGTYHAINTNIQAEAFCTQSGTQLETTSDTGGGQNVGYIDANDWLAYRVNIPTAGTYTIQYRVASQTGGGSIRFERSGGGTVFGTISVGSTTGWQTWTTIQHNVTLPAGQQEVAIVALAGGFNLNWFRINSTSSVPIGQVIWLRGSNAQYVSSENGANPMMCNRPTIGGWEQFTVVDAGSGRIALRGTNNMYVSSENGTRTMQCNRASIGGWEQFTWVANSNGTVSLRGTNNLYVSSMNGASAMMCDRASIGGWEQFTWGTGTSGTSVAEAVEVEPEFSDIELYPNPSSGSLTITVPRPTEVKIQELMKGAVIHSMHVERATTIDGLKPGMYAVVFVREGKRKTKKLIVK